MRELEHNDHMSGGDRVAALRRGLSRPGYLTGLPTVSHIGAPRLRVLQAPGSCSMISSRTRH